MLYIGPYIGLARLETRTVCAHHMSRTHAPCPGVAVLFLLRARARAPSFFQNALCDVSAHGTAARCPACLLHHDHPSQSQSPYPCCDVACRQGEALRGDQRTSLLKLKDQAALFFRMTLPKAKSHRRISSRFPTLPPHCFPQTTLDKRERVSTA